MKAEAVTNTRLCAGEGGFSVSLEQAGSSGLSQGGGIKIPGFPSQLFSFWFSPGWLNGL